MMFRKTAILPLGAATAIAAVCAMTFPTAGTAQSDRFLSHFEGDFSGSGTLQRGVEGGGRSINCNVTGTPLEGEAINIKGSCGVLIFRSGVNATIRQDGGSYTGLWQDRNSTSDLSGTRSGDTLTLNISRRGGALASGAGGTMVVRATAPDQYVLTVESAPDAEKPQRVDVTLNRG